MVCARFPPPAFGREAVVTNKVHFLGDEFQANANVVAGRAGDDVGEGVAGECLTRIGGAGEILG